MLIGAKRLTLTDNAFTSRQMYPTMSAANHIFAGFVHWRVFPPDHATMAFDEAVNNPAPQRKKYQFDQYHLTPVLKRRLRNQDRT
jgi:hypothetical protein